MYKHKGFTAVELAVVMVVMGLLLVVGMVGFRSFQSSARDNERQTDASGFANYLESIYPKEIKNSIGVVVKPAGTYPALPGGPSHTGVNDSNFKLMIDGAQKSSLQFPGGGSIVLPIVNNGVGFGACQMMKSCYTQTVPTAAGLGTKDFMYRPETGVLSDGNKYVCSSTTTDGVVPVNSCRSFVIFYVFEREPTIVKKLESKRR